MSKPYWADDGPLEVWWWAPKPQKSWGIKGLGISGELLDDTASPVIEWSIELRPFGGFRPNREKRKRLDSVGWESEGEGWWSLPLCQTTDDRLPLVEMLQEVVDKARNALSEDWGLVVADSKLGPLAGASQTLGDAVGALLQSTAAAEALEAAEDSLLEALRQAIDQRLGAGSVRPSKRGDGKLFIDNLRRQTTPADMNTWSELTGSGAEVGLWVWVGTARYHDTLAERWDQLRLPAGATTDQGTGKYRCLRVLLPATTAELTIDTLEQVATAVSEFLVDHCRTAVEST